MRNKSLDCFASLAMTTETHIIERLRQIATHPAARGLLDDVAVIDGLVITHDSIAEDVHFLSFDPPASVGWKLVAVNLSDLAGKGATPAGALLSLTIAGDGQWESDFLSGVEQACESYGLPLIGGDTIALPNGAPRVLGMTAIGRAETGLPARSGAKPGDKLWLVGTVGDSAAGLKQLRSDRSAAGPLVDIYRRPVPQMGAGITLAPKAHAMMDVSDGLLLDALRIAQASGVAASIELSALPLSSPFVTEHGQGVDARLFAATAGDDYALLAALPDGLDPATLSLPEGTRVTCIGRMEPGAPGIRLEHDGRSIALPERLGFEHSSNQPVRASSSPMGDRP